MIALKYIKQGDHFQIHRPDDMIDYGNFGFFFEDQPTFLWEVLLQANFRYSNKFSQEVLGFQNGRGHLSFVFTTLNQLVSNGSNRKLRLHFIEFFQLNNYYYNLDIRSLSMYVYFSFNSILFTKCESLKIYLQRSIIH